MSGCRWSLHLSISWRKGGSIRKPSALCHRAVVCSLRTFKVGPSEQRDHRYRFPPASDPRAHTIGAHVYASAECRFRFLKAEETAPRANDLFQVKHSRRTALGRTEVSAIVSLGPPVSTGRTETKEPVDLNLLLGFASTRVRGHGPSFPD
ncbi:unnamed protein product [Pipistrellus nathusii]|uniref:Uncharacterized protein n=1 Tax=Pipistrellus nathusii TaxID=59473 RepID=A0ABN9ZYG0_PIPNA